MTVKRKVSRVTDGRDRIELSPHLKRVREAISQLPEESTMNTETNGSTTATPNKPSTVKKKTVAKKTPAKKAPAKVNGASEGTTLATICKQLKMEPRKARRILRGADGVPDAGARWTFTKAADVAKVTKILKNAVAE